MAKVVKLEDAAKGKAEKAASRAGGRPRKRGDRARTALVLGGGGFTGGVYEIGGQRGDPRGDDAGGQPAGADSVRGGRPRNPAAPQLRRLRAQGSAASLPHG